MITCKCCGCEMSEEEFARSILAMLTAVENKMKDDGSASLGNVDYIFLKDLQEAIAHSINV